MLIGVFSNEKNASKALRKDAVQIAIFKDNSVFRVLAKEEQAHCIEQSTNFDKTGKVEGNKAFSVSADINVYQYLQDRLGQAKFSVEVTIKGLRMTGLRNTAVTITCPFCLGIHEHVVDLADSSDSRKRWSGCEKDVYHLYVP